MSKDDDIRNSYIEAALQAWVDTSELPEHLYKRKYGRFRGFDALMFRSKRALRGEPFCSECSDTHVIPDPLGPHMGQWDVITCTYCFPPEPEDTPFEPSVRPLSREAQ